MYATDNCLRGCKDTKKKSLSFVHPDRYNRLHSCYQDKTKTAPDCNKKRVGRSIHPLTFNVYFHFYVTLCVFSNFFLFWLVEFTVLEMCS